MTILKEAVDSVITKAGGYKEAIAYYEGNVPEVFATERLRRVFKVTGDRSRMNYCRPVVHAVSDRLEVGTISGDSPEATAIIQKVWRDNDLGLESLGLHRNALAAGDYYAIVWPDADGEWDVSFHSPLNVSVVYDPQQPRKKAYGVHMWRSGEAEHRINLYYADRVEKYVAQTGDVTDGTQWNHTETVDNPFGRVPVFHFRTDRPYGRPEHYDAYDCQNAINKLFITNMHTIDYQGAPTRYALSNVPDGEISDFEEGDTDRENLGALKNDPGSLWYLKGVTSVGEFKPADPAAFWTPIDKTLRSMAAITNTPLHYFERYGGNPTGNALRTAEAPLLKKIEDRKRSFGYTWRELFMFILNAEGVESDVVVYWQANESLDELERWDVSLKKINAGLSHRQALREGGYTDDQIEQIMAERESEQAAGLYYQRAPQTRMNTSSDETTPKEQENDAK